MKSGETFTAQTCIPLPKSGGDEVFGRSRSTWLRWESKGFIKLRRFKIPGAKHATTVCIPLEAAEEFIKTREGFDLT